LSDRKEKEGEASAASPSLPEICNNNLFEVYKSLIAAFGPQNWWPAEGPEEMIIGALLTQNTTWSNVEKALANLRTKNLLSFSAILETPLSEIESLIKPSGYFRQKSLRHGLKIWPKRLSTPAACRSSKPLRPQNLESGCSISTESARKRLTVYSSTHSNDPYLSLMRIL